MDKHDTCYLGPCWENVQRDGGPPLLTKLHVYRIRRERRFANSEDEARRIVAANS